MNAFCKKQGAAKTPNLSYIYRYQGEKIKRNGMPVSLKQGRAL